MVCMCGYLRYDCLYVWTLALRLFVCVDTYVMMVCNRTGVDISNNRKPLSNRRWTAPVRQWPCERLWDLEVSIIDISCRIICFVDRASLYNLVNKANFVHSFSYYVYFFSLHVSGYYVTTTSRNNRIYATLVTCYSIWITVWYAGAYVEERNKYTKKNCAPCWLYLQDFLVQFNHSKPNVYSLTKRPTSSALHYTHTIYCVCYGSQNKG